MLIGFRPTLNYRVLESFSSPEGFYLVLNCLIEDKPVTLVSVYLPPGLSLVLFNRILQNIQEKVCSYANPDVLWFGDFNAILTSGLDANRPRVTPYSEPLKGFMENNELSDVWRGLHPSERCYTCFTGLICFVSS